MKPRKQQIEEMFHRFAADLSRVRPELAGKVMCPLCLRAFGRDNIHLLSVEHVIPSELGGTVETFSCTECNNQHGSRLDKHLVQAIKALDSLEGRIPIRAVMNREGHIAMNVFLQSGTTDDPIRLSVVRQASRQSAIEYLLENPPKQGESLKLQLHFGFIPERYWAAAVRAAYLSVFSVEGYVYILSEGAAQVRGVLNGQQSVSAGVVTAACPDTESPSGALIMPSRFKDIGDYYAVLLRVQAATVRHLCVFLPGKQGIDWGSFKLLAKYADRLRLETTPIGWTSKLFIKLQSDPVIAFRSPAG